jgi:hypothetical protein
MASGFLLPIGALYQGFSDQGVVGSGFKINTYVGGSVSTPVVTYTDSTLTVPNSNPIALGSNGRFQSVNCWVAGGTLVKLVLTDSNNNPIVGGTIDNVAGVNDISLTPATVIGQAIWPRTTAEITASITPTNYGYSTNPYDIRRYGADPTGVSASDSALSSALAVATAISGLTISFPEGTFTFNNTYSMPAGTRLVGSGRYITLLNYTGSGAFLTWGTASARGSMEGFQINGTGRTGTGISLGNATAGSTEMIFRELLIKGFNLALRMGGANWVFFEKCEFGNAAGGAGNFTNNTGIDFNFAAAGNYTAAVTFQSCTVSNNANAGVAASNVPLVMDNISWYNCDIQNNCQLTPSNPQFYMGPCNGFVIDNLYSEYVMGGTAPDLFNLSGLQSGRISSVYSNVSANCLKDRTGNTCREIEITAVSVLSCTTAALSMANENNIIVRNCFFHSGTASLTGTGCTYLPLGSGLAAWPTDEVAWTPALTFQTSGSVNMTVQNGTYSVVGNVLSFNARIDWTTLSAPTGNVSITGFPIAPKTGGPDFAVALGYTNNVTIAAGYLAMTIAANATTGLVYNVQSTTARLQGAAFSASGSIIISGSYQI